MVYFYLLGCLLASGDSVEHFRVRIEPIDFRISPNLTSDEFPHSPRRAVVSGEYIYLSSPQDGFITVMTRNGEVVDFIGRTGNGPGEFGSGLLAITVYGEHLFAVARSAPERMLYFKNGQFVKEVSLHSNNVSHIGSRANRFAASDSHVVVPAHPGTGHLAFAYRISDGAKKPLGELVFGRADSRILEKNPGKNDTFWVYGNGSWFAVFRYEPLIFKFDDAFQFVASVQLQHPRVGDIKDEVEDVEEGRFSTPPFLFHDVSYKDGYLYLLARRTLFRVSVKTGRIDRIYTFYGVGVDFEQLETNMQLTFSFMGLLPDNEIILGPGFIWNHDLWRAKLPE